METAYQEWEKRRQARARRHTGSQRRKDTKVTLGTRERRRLLQLGVCIALFLMVFIGKGFFPDQLMAVRERILSIMRTDTDFTAAFSSMGQSFEKGEPVLDTLGELWVDVFGGSTVAVSTTATQKDSLLYQASLAYLTGQAMKASPYALGFTRPEVTVPQAITQENEPLPTPIPTVEPEPELTAVPTVIHKDYSGPALPDNTTMDQYTLGLTQTVTPVIGWVSSGFGWREHPVDGGEKFHNGVDLAVNSGTEVKAFAAGVVDYIGESPIYGNYVQLKHDGGVTTFYAHNNRLCVQQGDTVTAGQKIAESGETGNATGPHLHFEIKRDGIRLNPLYYIETQ